jgi:hypothetical protein
MVADKPRKKRTPAARGGGMPDMGGMGGMM